MVLLCSRPGGVLTRLRHTEVAVDLCALTGMPRTSLLCELMNDDEVWSMMRRAFTDKFGLPIISVPMLVDHRKQIEGVDAQL